MTVTTLHTLVVTMQVEVVYGLEGQAESDDNFEVGRDGWLELLRDMKSDIDRGADNWGGSTVTAIHRVKYAGEGEQCMPKFEVIETEDLPQLVMPVNGRVIDIQEQPKVEVKVVEVDNRDARTTELKTLYGTVAVDPLDLAVNALENAGVSEEAIRAFTETYNNLTNK